MSIKVRHVLGISGGKDSAALAIYLKTKFPELELEYYFCDTEKELDETYRVIEKLEVFLGKKIIKLKAAENSTKSGFDHFLELYGGYLPSPSQRWCTKKLKLQPFEKYIGDEPVVSYVGIRGDESREGYISKKSNIQSVFPFRNNIWSVDVIRKVLADSNIDYITDIALEVIGNDSSKDEVLTVLTTKLSQGFNLDNKLNRLINLDAVSFNKVVFKFLKGTDYPLGTVDSFPLIGKDDSVVLADVYRMLEESGVGVPEYYKEKPFTVNDDGKELTGYYSRSRSGCYFCFFQQKIEWVWLYEQHPKLFYMAMEYEKDGYSWMDNERLEDLVKPERIKEIKLLQIKRIEKGMRKNNKSLIDILDADMGNSCPSCFI
ncbi:phosphoadenosine phosphosulfate reductase family protein [Limisalsivibrio acetivorans]|uniref:phosphoadenosine phosphosulfate reductase domain-containing protein n=1 Tax=Limisalsivibrio acetivorans TaxID=1304888 RepID=UPI0003B4E89F|nr:phosphoadenosine phosphosulfate reductase family protein [Limisalsivibrio acetivorans]